MSTQPEGDSPHDTGDADEEAHTSTETPDWEAVGHALARDRLEVAAADLQEAFYVAAHADDLTADDIRELFGELNDAAIAVGQIAEHTPGVEDESNPYRHLDGEEIKKAIGLDEENSA